MKSSTTRRCSRVARWVAERRELPCLQAVQRLTRLWRELGAALVEPAVRESRLLVAVGVVREREVAVRDEIGGE